MKPVAASRFWDSQNGVVGLTEGWRGREGESDKDKQKEIMICTCFDRFRSLIHSIFRCFLYFLPKRFLSDFFYELCESSVIYSQQPTRRLDSNLVYYGYYPALKNKRFCFKLASIKKEIKLYTQ